MYVRMCNNCYTFFQYPTYGIFNNECFHSAIKKAQNYKCLERHF